MHLTHEQQDYWDVYVRTLEKPPSQPQVTAGIAGDSAIADELLSLYLNGSKTAGSSLVRDYELTGEEFPGLEDYWIILDSSGHPRCIVKTVRVEFFVFGEVPEHVAIAEGEGDLSVAYWKRAHKDFFEPFLAEWGVMDLNKARVVTEFFELVYP